MTASDSSSSAASRPERPQVDLLAAGLVGALPAAFLEGRDLDLLAPLPFLAPGELPGEAPAAPDRGELARALAVANASYGHPRAGELAARLADPATRVVVAGQQPGLLGGPLYTLSKAVAAARWAARLEEAGVPAIPLFWVATEDHDFREIARAVFLTPREARTFDLGGDPAPLMPVGMRTLGPGMAILLDELTEAMPGERFAAWVETLAGWYRPQARFGEAFCRLMVHLLGARCPLLVDAMLPAVKAAQRPHLRRLVELRHQVDEALAARAAEVTGRGHELQVAPQPGLSPLFMIHRGERRRIEWVGDDGLRLRGGEVEEGIDWLLAAIDENPGVVSPGVLARPAIQDAIFGTTLHLAGPGEVSYLPQAAPVYRLLEAPLPWIVARPQALVLEVKQLEKMKAAGLELAELVDAELDLDARLAGETGEEVVGATREGIEESLAALRQAALAVDPNLEAPWSKTRGQMVKALDTFAGKVTAAAARRDEVARGRARALRDACRPLGAPQERVVSSSHFPGKHGESFVAAMFEQMELDPRQLQVVVL